MPGIDDEFLDEDTVVAERAFRFRARPLETVAYLRRIPGDAHALAAAAGGSLDHHRIADLGGYLLGMDGVFDDAQPARHGRDLGGVGEFFRFDLVAHRTNGLGLGADEDDALLLENFAEGCPFGEEAIAGMHGLRAGLFAGFDDLLGDEVALRSGRRADVDRLIRHLDMHGIAVGVRIDGDGGNAHLPRRLDHPAGDLAAIGDQDFLEHG